MTCGDPHAASMKAWLSRQKERSRDSAAQPPSHGASHPAPDMAAGFAAAGISLCSLSSLLAPGSLGVCSISNAGRRSGARQPPPRAKDPAAAFKRDVCVLCRRDEDGPALGRRAGVCCGRLLCTVEPAGEHTRLPPHPPPPESNVGSRSAWRVGQRFDSARMCDQPPFNGFSTPGDGAFRRVLGRHVIAVCRDAAVTERFPRTSSPAARHRLSSRSDLSLARGQDP